MARAARSSSTGASRARTSPSRQPHTKPFPFWEGVIGEVERDHPTCFLCRRRYARTGCTASQGAYPVVYASPGAARRQSHRVVLNGSRASLARVLPPELRANTPDILNSTGERGRMSHRGVMARRSPEQGIYGPAAIGREPPRGAHTRSTSTGSTSCATGNGEPRASADRDRLTVFLRAQRRAVGLDPRLPHDDNDASSVLERAPATTGVVVVNLDPPRSRAASCSDWRVGLAGVSRTRERALTMPVHVGRRRKSSASIPRTTCTVFAVASRRTAHARQPRPALPPLRGTIAVDMDAIINAAREGLRRLHATGGRFEGLRQADTSATWA